MIQDTYNRTIDYMRISITDRCNLRCKYCMPDDIALIPHQEIMRYEEFLRLARIFSKQGISKIKVTGGEPLIRLGCVDFIRDLKQIEGIRSVTLTTNGVLLSEKLPGLLAAGVDAINISLDTLKRERFAQIAGKDEFERVWRGIQEASSAGIKIKLNCVPILEYNADEIPDFFELARKHPIDVRFIEMMPIGNGKKFQPVLTDEILRQLKDRYKDISEIQEVRGNGPAVYYSGKDFAACVGVIGAVHRQFCSSCNRIRLTSEGFLKLCLYHKDGVDLKKLIREGAEDEVIAQTIREAILKKPKEHHFLAADEGDRRNMSQIGG